VRVAPDLRCLPAQRLIHPVGSWAGWPFLPAVRHRRTPDCEALGFFTHLAGGRAVAWSGGSEPGIEVNRTAVDAMAERGVDISGEYPKPWTEEVVRAADVVVTMGCGDTCPIVPGTRYENWDLDDPAGKTIEEVRPVRDEIARRVRRLLGQLDVPVAA
jgi:arsenate reductase